MASPSSMESATADTRFAIVDESIIGAMPNKELRAYYRRQNDLVAAYAVADRILEARGGNRPPSPEPAEPKAVQLAITLSFLANIVLFASKVAVAVYSGSLAVVVSAVDSSLDLLSGSILFIASRAIAKKEPERFPVGKQRFEPLAIVVFASVMGVASLQIIIEGITTILDNISNPTSPNIDVFSYAVIGATIVIKAALFVLCFSQRRRSESAATLALDHRNDVLTNSATLVALILIGWEKSLWWLDPAMAMLLGVLIVTSWSITGREHIARLAGRAAEPEAVSQIIYLALHHDPRIQQVDSVQAYYSGQRLLVELDIVLPADMPLREAHDVGLALQKDVERLPDVERCFVHLDYEARHKQDEEHVPPSAL